MKSLTKIGKTLRTFSGFALLAAIPWGHVSGYGAMILGIFALPFPVDHLRTPRPKRVLMFLFSAFFLWGLILSLFVADNRIASVEALFTYFAHWALPFILGYAIASRHSLRIIYVWIGSLLLLGTVSLMAYLSLFHAPNFSSEGLLKGLHTHIQFGTLLLIALHLILGMFLTPKIESKKTYIFGIMGVIFAFMIFLTGSRGVWLAGAVSITGALIHSAITRRRRRISLLFLILIAVCGAAAIAIFPQVRYRINRTGTDDPSYIYRKNMAIMATEIISDYPITGIGPGGVPYAKEYYELMEERNLPVETGYLKKKHLHDLYLHITAEFGIPGLLILLGIFGTLFWLAISAIRNTKNLEKGLSYGFLWAIVAVGVGEILDCLLRGPPVAIEFFFIAGLIAGILADSTQIEISSKSPNAGLHADNQTSIELE